MLEYTTGEIARLCGVTVRTVQYYDARNILVPSRLSEGGRRLYSEQDLRRMKIICFLRDAGISIGSIGALFSEDDPGTVITELLGQQEALLRGELEQCQNRLGTLEEIRRELKRIENFSVDSIGDIAYIVENRQKMRLLHTVLLLTGIPFCIMQWAAVILWITSGIWWPFLTVMLAMLPYGVWVTRYYFTRVAYICPQCHKVFRPGLREAFWANHTPALRRLRCPCCGRRGFCVEVYNESSGG